MSPKTSKNNLRSFFKKSTLATLILSTVLVLPTHAISGSTLDFYDQNDIWYYDPDGGACTSATTGSYDGEASAGLSELQAAFVDQYHDIAEKLSIAYGIPWETVMAQGILESASGTSNFAVQRNNFFGIGAFDSNPDNAYSYATPAEGWQGYYENIKNTSTYREHGVFQGDTITDPYAYLEAIKAAGYATDPNYVSSVSSIIKAIENRASEKGWLSSAELAQKYPEMKTNAAANAAGGDGESADVTSTLCSSGNGDINATAIELSWPESGHDPWNDPKPEYKTALAETGVNQLGDSCSMNGNSCDAFVATVLRYSGADENVPCCGAANILAYFQQHPELYEEIPNTGSTSDLQPGDIRSKESHIEIFVQLDDGSYAIASASHCDRTADHASSFYADSSFHVFRFKGSN